MLLPSRYCQIVDKLLFGRIFNSLNERDKLYMILLFCNNIPHVHMVLRGRYYTNEPRIKNIHTL